MPPKPSLSLDTPDSRLTKLAHLRRISNLWDRALGLPGTEWRVGLESLIGLLPLGGDWIGLLLSSYILFHAVQFNLPKSMMLRMVFNLLLDAIVGSVPILGDLFDTTWKANTKNVNLLEAHLRSPTASRRKDQTVIWLFLVSFILILLTSLGISLFFIFLLSRLLPS